jgi:hypothetical protein
MSLDEEYPKTHRNLLDRLRAVLRPDAALSAAEKEEIVLALNEIADYAADLAEIMERLVNEQRTPAEVGELLIAFELTTEQIRGWSDGIDGKLYDVGDRLKTVQTLNPDPTYPPR